MKHLVRWLPELLAVVVVALNAVKPVVVDDTAYLMHARHLAAEPTKPYAFLIFWNDIPQPGMSLLLPPVLPYWLSLGIRLFGEDLLLMKLWLLPFTLLLARSVHSLLRRFARGAETSGTVLIVTSPLVLPLFNFMLDIPAVALGLACLAVTAKAVAADRHHIWLIGLAALLGALAAQTKYTLLPLPAVLLWYGVTHGRFLRTAGIAALGVALFATWEVWICRTSGESHFLYHLQNHSGANKEAAGVIDRIDAFLTEKFKPVQPLACYLGGMAVPFSLWAAYGLAMPRKLIGLITLASLVGIAAVCLVPGNHSVLMRNGTTGQPALTLPMLVFSLLGWSFLATIAAAATLLVIRRRGWTANLRWSPKSQFLAGWWMLEIFAYFLLTPFPAGRRVILVGLVGGLIAVRFARLRKSRPGLVPMIYGIIVCLGLWAIDCFDASAERTIATQAADRIDREVPSGASWTQGHWGWQYYAERRGMKLIVPGQSILKPGDFLVLPVEPEAGAFYRPYHGEAYFVWDADCYRFVERIATVDSFPAATIPTLYGGKFPIVGRSHPRLIVDVYRVEREVVTVPDQRR